MIQSHQNLSSDTSHWPWYRAFAHRPCTLSRSAHGLEWPRQHRLQPTPVHIGTCTHTVREVTGRCRNHGRIICNTRLVAHAQRTTRNFCTRTNTTKNTIITFCNKLDLDPFSLAERPKGVLAIVLCIHSASCP